MDVRDAGREDRRPMTSTALLSPNSFLYVDSDIPEGQTLVDWRRARNAAAAASRPPRRGLRLPRLRRAG
jgi:hypothetical protein